MAGSRTCGSGRVITCRTRRRADDMAGGWQRSPRPGGGPPAGAGAHDGAEHVGSTGPILGRRAAAVPPVPRRAAAVRVPVLGGAVLGVVALAAAAGCQGDGPTVSLQNKDPAGKIPAMKQAAERQDRSAVPDLVQTLESDDPAERLYAIEALRRITGQDLGYNYYGSDEQRASGVQRWKTWLGTRQLPGTRQPSPPESRPARTE